MLVKKAIEIKLYPNRAQQVFFNKTFGCCRFVYNQYLRLKSRIYEETKMAFQPKLKSFKEEWPWLKEADAQALGNAYMDMNHAYQSFFSGRTRYPRYKSKKGKQSYRNAMCHKDIKKLIVGNTIVLPKIGAVKCRFGKTFEHENIKKIYNVTIKKSKKGDYYCSICCDVDVLEMLHTGGCVGIDLGIKSSIVMSNGEIIKNPHFEKKSERKIRHLQRKLAKAKKGGSRYEKVRIQLAAAHEKLGNRRNNFLHQVSHRLVRDYDIICMENLNIKGMQKNHCLAGALARQALGTLTKMIAYKAQWHNRTVVKVGRFFPSSQLCNNCGHHHHTLKLREREWICPGCGSLIDRDWNAAKNILDEGLRILDNKGTPRTGEAVVLRPLCLAENPTVDDRPPGLKSSGAVMREI